MNNYVTVSPLPVIQFRDLVRGAIFRMPTRFASAVFLKTGTIVVDLATGEVSSIDQTQPVQPLPLGSVVTIEVGAAK